MKFSRLVGAMFLCLGSSATLVQADDWPQWMGPQRDGVWRETGIVDKFPSDGPPVRWRVKIGGGYAGPAVVGDRVYVTDKQLPQGTEEASSEVAHLPQSAFCVWMTKTDRSSGSTNTSALIQSATPPDREPRPS